MTGVLTGYAAKFCNFSLDGGFLDVEVLDQNQKAVGWKFFTKRTNRVA